MEENKSNEENIKIKEEVSTTCCKHPLLKSIMIGLLIFLGAYCAFYTVADWHYKTMFRHTIAGDVPRKMEHLMRKEMRAMDAMFAEDAKLSRKAGNIIHLKQTKDFYKISIDLRAFDNNENNVQVTTSGNILTINGRTIRKSKHNEQISEFQQQYLFGSNVKLSELTKSTEGNFYIITIPIEQDDED
ncbi:MAG: Hsp20/alpha crystallin family protein [Candidatus Gastranaerophilaceae bacterium]